MTAAKNGSEAAKVDDVAVGDDENTSPEGKEEVWGMVIECGDAWGCLDEEEVEEEED